jgi:hypothetical protein
MDGDDISHRDRLARQFAAMNDPAVVGVGTLYEGIDVDGARVRPRDRWRLLAASAAPPFAHGSTMFRRSVYDEVGGYREACAGWEDQDLFLRMAAKGLFLVLPEAYYYYRYHRSSTSTQWDLAKRERILALRTLCLTAHGGGSDYGPLLSSGTPAPVTRSIAATAVRYETGMRLWSGDPPRGFSPLPGTKQLGPRLWAAWGSIHPSSLRMLLRGVIRLRDAAAGLVIRDGKVYRWRSA